MKGTGIIGNKIKNGAGHKVKVYDFKRPDKFSKDQIRTLAVMHETFARLTSESLSSSLRMECKLHLKLVDQVTYGEFIKATPRPAVMLIVKMAPLKGDAILDIEPPLAYAVIDRIFGGVGKPQVPERDLSDFERFAVEGLSVRILANLAESWNPVMGLGTERMRPSLGQIETNPHFAMIVPPTEMTLLIAVEAMIGDTKGTLRLCIPYLTIEPLISRLSAQYWYSSVRRRPASPKPLAENLKLETQLYLEAERMSLKKLAMLKKRMLIRLPGYTGGRAFLMVGGENVLKLKRKDDQALAFDVDEESGRSFDWKGNIPALRRPELEGEERLEDLLKSRLEGLSGKIESYMQNLDRKISEINARQDELSDQLYFSHPDREVPEKAPMAELQMKPFGFVRAVDRDALYTFIANEHPQAVAVVLAYLDHGLAAIILEQFDDRRQADLAERIATLEQLHPDVIKGLERIIAKKLKAPGAAFMAVGGISSVVEILNLSRRGVEKNVVETLEKENSELAEEIKKNMFVFEDLVLLDKEALRILLDRVERADLLHALKSVDERVREFIYAAMPGTDLADFRQDLERTGRLRLSAVEEAQQRIILKIRELEETGLIVVGRKGEVVD